MSKQMGRVVLFGATCIVACGSPQTMAPAGGGGAATSPTAVSGGGGELTGGVGGVAAGVAGSLAMSGGAAGTSGAGMPGGGVAGQAELGGAGGAAGAPAGGQAAAGATGACAPGALICEDFERFASGSSDLSPEWISYSYQGGLVRVDDSKPHAGSRSLHLSTTAGARHYADIVKINPPDQPLLPNHHYGRAMVWLKTIPSQAHFLINHASGPLAADPSTVAKYSYGGHLGRLEPTYSQKMPVGGVEHPALRGGGPELGDPFPAPVDCQRTATSEPVPTQRWMCWEWSFDADKSETHLWIDGQAMTEVDLSIQTPGSCKTVQGPKLFNKLVIGWEVYTAASEVDQEAYIDDLVIAATRVGCPVP